MAINFPNTVNVDYTRTTVTTSSSNTTVTGAKPSGTLPNELLLFKLSAGGSLNPNNLSLPTDVVGIGNNFSANGANALHCAFAYYITPEDAEDIPANFVFTIGGAINDDELIIQRVTGVDLTNPIDAIATTNAGFTNSQTAGPISQSVTTVTNGAVAIVSVSGKGATAITQEDAGQPTGTTLLLNKRTRNNSSGINSGWAYMLQATAGATGTKQWSTYTSSAQWTSTFAFALRPAVNPVFSAINADNTVRLGSSGNTATTVNLTDANAMNIDGWAMTAFAGSNNSYTFSCPGLVDGQQIRIGAQTGTITNGTSSPTRAVTVLPPVNMNDQGLVAPLNTLISGVLYNFSPAAAADDHIFYTPVPAVGFYTTVDNHGNLVTNYEGTQQMWHYQASTDIVRSYDVITGPGGVILGVVRSLKTTLRSNLKNTLKNRH